MHKSLPASLIIILLCFAMSCKKDGEPATPQIVAGDRVLVACEGSLGNGNGALCLHWPDSNRTVRDVYQSVNGQGLGDVFQSLTRIGDRYFLCINNSDKIVVLDRETFLQAGSISIPKPRYILQVSDTKAYVSTIFSNKVYIINTKTLTVTGTITLPFMNPEGMVLAGGKAFICPWDTAVSAIYPVDIGDDALGSPVAVGGRAPQEILQDKEGMLWVLSGNKAKGKEAKLTRIDPATGSILKVFAFGNADPVRPAFNPAKDTLYFIEVDQSGGSADNGVYRMGIHDGALPAQAFVPAQGFQYFWGVGVHPVSGQIYIADPVGFTQLGTVYAYRPDGSLANTFQTAVGPGHFLFD
jgi:YVTN family beta-propeller protein